MNSIIRSNAIETSSPTENSGINFHKLYPYGNLVSEKAFIYRSDVDSTKGALAQASTATQLQIASTNTGYWSTSIQTLLEQLPFILAHLVTLKSIAFFTVVVVWAWTGKIEQVSHVRGKFVALSEPHTHQPQHLSKVVHPVVEEAPELTAGQVVAELDSEFLGLDSVASDQMPFNHIKDLMAQTRMLAQTRVSARVQDVEILPVQPKVALAGDNFTNKKNQIKSKSISHAQ
jgi:hypothetical protein